MENEKEFDVALKEKEEFSYPKKYKVFLLNDDFTTMEFVVEILMNIFHKTEKEATNIMLKVHKEGRGYCGSYCYEIAETKVTQVITIARKNEFPLKAIMEEE